MEMKLEMVSVDKLVDAYSGVSMLDSTQTIMEGLTQLELDRYGKAMDKIEKGQTLNIKDLKVFDRIDALTYQKHGMCLKDSHVTKARIKASKKYGVIFIDRDGLINHMNQMMDLPAKKNQKEGVSTQFSEKVGCLILDHLGEERFMNFGCAISRIMGGIKLTIDDLKVLSEVEYFVFKELGISILNKQIQNVIEEACVQHKFDFASASKKVVH